MTRTLLFKKYPLCAAITFTEFNLLSHLSARMFFGLFAIFTLKMSSIENNEIHVFDTHLLKSGKSQERNVSNQDFFFCEVLIKTLIQD